MKKVMVLPGPVGRIVGYARVSTYDQRLEVQEEALRAAGCVEVFAETMSGRKKVGREELERCLAGLKSGDTLVVMKLDRIARSVRDLVVIMTDLVDRGIGFQCLTQGGIDLNSITGRFMLHVLGAVAEFEVELIRERSVEGIARARREHPEKYAGRKPKFDKAEVRAAVVAEGLSANAAMERFGMSRTRVYQIAGDLWRPVCLPLKRRAG